MNNFSRRGFVKSILAAPACIAAPVCVAASEQERGAKHPLAGKKLPAWKPGEFQVHFIYTGVAESQFWIMPDGTTMLIDCGDHAAWQRGKKAIWILPNGRRHAGEWIARYVERVNPAKADVDYMMISHHHDDHAGRDGWGGFMDAAATLKFRRGFDRGWPDFDDPIPNERCDTSSYPHVRKTLSYLIERDGLKMEKFVVGAVDQIALLRDAARHTGFKVTNITGNGKILCRDGSVRDLYAEKHDAKRLNENGMSLGLLVQYGPFRYYTAGDFFDRLRLPDKSARDFEVELAREIDPVDVAKIDHHGHHSMALELVAALRARVWTACMWDQLHITADTLSRLSSREAYPGPRLVAPGVFSPERRFEDVGKEFLADIARESFDAGHVVVTVAPGGATYSVAYVTADDESMKVTGAYDFESASGRR